MMSVPIPTNMNQHNSDFAFKINRQRTSPRIADFSFILTRFHLKIIKRFAGMTKPGAKVLDVGCGYQPWRKFFPSETQYIGIDYSTSCSNANALGSADALPFQDSCFDSVICSEVLEHTQHPALCIEELRRICKPGGYIYISTPFAFPEHGVPYDFQRFTQYFYRTAFQDDEIAFLEPSNSTFASTFGILNLSIECTPLSKLWGFRHLAYFCFNLSGILADKIINFAGPKLLKDSRLYTHGLPLGYSLIVRKA